MAATSMMKEYLKKQLKYWVDNFKDDQLPRDFHSKNFSRPQITLSKISLKPDKIASLLHIPAPLIVTRAICSELVIKVPSWNAAEKFVQEPLSLKLGDLFIDVKHFDECDDHVRKDSIARARAASLEPDPLGSIASMYQFATIISERLEITVENVYIKVYEKQALRLRVELAHFHARTTNAMWQDMRDLTDCVDRSPDGLLKTRFKFISMQGSVYLHPHGVDQQQQQQAPPPLKLLRDHLIAMRMTLFGHRKSKQDAWETLSRVVDLNLDTLPFEMDLTQVQQVYEAYQTVARWINGAAAAATSGDANGQLLPHQLMRGPLTPKRKPTRSEPKETPPKVAAVSHDPDDHNADDAGGDGASSSTFALQVTVRFTAHALLKFRSERRGDLQLAVIAQHVAINWIQHQGDSHEVQVTVHDISVRHKDKVLFYAKPAREVLQYKRLSGESESESDGDTSSSLFLKWHLHKLECHLENEIALIANEIYHSFNEMEQAATITCGTCHHKIPLDAIGSHVCSTTTSSSPRSAAAPASPEPKGSRTGTNAINTLLNSTQVPKLRVVFALDELSIVTDSHLFRTVHEMMRRPNGLDDMKLPAAAPARRFTVKMNDLSLSTESKEFVGAAIFVPVLPLAFQMLECTIRGCGCVEAHQRKQRQRSKQEHNDHHSFDTEAPCRYSREVPRWPDRVFAELGHLSVKAIDTATKMESFLVADKASLRLSFSDGRQVCAQSTPQMSCFFHIERIRCQLEHPVFQYMRRWVAKLQDPLEGKSIKALTLFFAVLEIRNVELTLLQEAKAAEGEGDKRDHAPRMKAQFRQVGGVADNHLGHLSLQTNFDFRALLHSQSVQFDFQRYELLMDSSHQTGAVETKRERRRRREEALYAVSAQRIQRAFRRFRAKRHDQVELQLRRLTHDDETEFPVVGMEESLVAAASGGDGAQDSKSETPSSSSPPVSPSAKRRTSAGKTAASMFGAAAEDLGATMNPMKMVAAAGVLKDGVMGFVKAKQQMIGSEMGELAIQSKESAARFMPKYSAVKNLLSPKAVISGVVVENSESMGKKAEVRAAEVEMASAIQVADENENRGFDFTFDTEAANENVEDPQGRETVEHDGEEDEREEEEHEREEDEEDGEEDDDQVGEDTTSSNGEPLEDIDENDTEVASSSPQPQHVDPTASFLASLPLIVRIMVQVEEHRLYVPISPREHVSVLCQEIVRRFNEMFANNGVISYVTLQNPQGGVFAGSDIVGLICDTTKKNELLFAYPHDEDSEIKSVVHINLSGEPAPPSPRGKDDHGQQGSKSSSFTNQNKQTSGGFSRCSKLPLPLVVALLANESERDLMSHILNQGGTNGEDWLELALNVSFLDPTKEMLQVEVSWQGKSVQVTNADAFLLCLQQLGLATARANSKSVGKVLRDRLQMNPKNPLIHTACTQSAEFQEEFNISGDNETPPAGISYESLKEIVQEDYGIYMRSKS